MNDNTPSHGAPEHQPVDGGFTCSECGATRQTPLGIARHREFCNRSTADVEEVLDS